MAYEFTQPQADVLRQRITENYYVPEVKAVENLLSTLQFTEAQEAQIHERARALVQKIREKKMKGHGVDALMHEYALGTEEGIALMCLAEALLRIPDDDTRYALIEDKLKDGDWRAHMGKGRSLFINAASWGLVLSRNISATYNDEQLGNALSRLFARFSAPMMRSVIERAMESMGSVFVTGETIDEALKNIEQREPMGYRFSFDMLGEAAMTAQDAERYYQDYVNAIHAVGKQAKGRGVYDSNGISVKLSAIHPRYARSQHERVMTELYPRLKALFMLAKEYDMGLNIDAEEANRLELSLDLLKGLLTDPELAGFKGIGFVIQAYSKRCPFVIDYVAELARQNGRQLMVRLVKGAYWDSEMKWAQTDGVEGFPLYTRKIHTDISYIACAQKLLAAQDVIFPQFATHNVQTLSTIAMLGEGKNFEFQCLQGMGESLYDNVVGKPEWGNRRVRVYAPVGTHETLLAYLVRRLLENGANSSFVHQLVDPTIPVDTIVAEPWKVVRQKAISPNGVVKAPADIFPLRKNALGLNLSHELHLTQLQEAMNAAQAVREIQSLSTAEMVHETPEPVTNPSTGETVGQVAFLRVSSAANVFEAAKASSWGAVPVAERAGVLRRAADLYEANMGAFVRLAVEEAGKTLGNAINEVREAVDFLRYYAEQIELLSAESKLAEPLGVALCISPWNFPLAIFTGQVVAALAAGNAVVAKPAEQTPLIAYAAVELLYQAGVPRDALHLVLGEGDLGAALVAQPFNAYLFTGSTEVARLIQAQVNSRDDHPVLIAETGGMNAMVVDSSALAEQVVADVINSAFDSAGQRCSALRILLVQSDVADRLYTMVSEAMNELRVGNPAFLNTDVGPVIDAQAQEQLQRYQAEIGRHAMRQNVLEIPAEGTFVAPSLYELPNLDLIQKEVFGPVLHFVRYDKENLSKQLSKVNSKGYALTGGCHSRIRQTIDAVGSELQCGNFYINRNVVGAVVGVQPFGGHGLSGTGPKAGGPLYVQRLTRSQNLKVVGVEAPVMLPSITGEENTYFLIPTEVLVVGGDVDSASTVYNRLTQLGFTVRFQSEHPFAQLKAKEGEVISQPFTRLQKVLCLTPISVEERQKIAANSRCVVNFYDWNDGGTLGFLYEEHSRSNNITAAGGNVNLMAAQEV